MQTKTIDEIVVAEQRADHPLFDEYLRVLEDHEGVPLGTVEVAQLALHRLGRPARDRTDAVHAEAHIRRLSDEVSHKIAARKPFDLRHLIVDTDYSYAGVLSDPDTLAGEELEIEVDDVLRGIPAAEIITALKQALTIAIPVVIAAVDS